MFGVLIPNKPVRTDFEQVTDTQLRMYISNVNQITNITIF